MYHTIEFVVDFVADVEVSPRKPLEQMRIVAKVEHLMKLCDDLEAKLRLADETARTRQCPRVDRDSRRQPRRAGR